MYRFPHGNVFQLAVALPGLNTLVDDVPEHDEGGLGTFLDIASYGNGLLVGDPLVVLVALLNSLGAKQEDVDALVGPSG